MEIMYKFYFTKSINIQTYIKTINLSTEINK